MTTKAATKKTTTKKKTATKRRTTSRKTSTNVLRENLSWFIGEVDTIAAVRASLANDLKRVKTEAKGRGINPDAALAVHKLRSMDPEEREEHERLMAAYEEALD